MKLRLHAGSCEPNLSEPCGLTALLHTSSSHLDLANWDARGNAAYRRGAADQQSRSQQATYFSGVDHARSNLACRTSTPPEYAVLLVSWHRGPYLSEGALQPGSVHVSQMLLPWLRAPAPENTACLLITQARNPILCTPRDTERARHASASRAYRGLPIHGLSVFMEELCEPACSLVEKRKENAHVEVEIDSLDHPHAARCYRRRLLRAWPCLWRSRGHTTWDDARSNVESLV